MLVTLAVSETYGRCIRRKGGITRLYHRVKIPEKAADFLLMYYRDNCTVVFNYR